MGTALLVNVGFRQGDNLSSFFLAYETIYLTKQGIGSMEILYKIDAYLIHSLDFI